jgi:glycosyltransferase involved in cell wall biosynthesis
LLSKKRIVMLLDNSFKPDPRVLREAEALVQGGANVKIVAWDRDEEVTRPEHEIMNGVEVVRIPIKSKRHLGVRQIIPYLKFAFRALKIIRTEKVDVVHCHDLPDLPIGVFVKAIKKVPLVYDAHEIYWIMDFNRYPKTISYLQKIGELFLLRWVDALITVGNKRVQYYRPHYSKDIFLVGNYYDPKKRDWHKRKEFRQSLSIPEDAFVLTYAGTLSKGRGIDLIMECAERFHQERRNVHFIIAGVGADEGLVRKAAALNPLMHFLGWVSDLENIFSGSDALVYLMRLSRRYTHYNSPNNLYLSIAWQLPLIAVAAGEIGNVLVPQESGMLLDRVEVDVFCEALLKLTRDQEAYQRIVKKLGSLQDDYSWKAACENLYRAYEVV